MLFAGLRRINVGICALVIHFATSAQLAPFEEQRLACFFYDREDPHGDVTFLTPGLQWVWARGLAKEEIFINGENRDGFLKANAVKGKTQGWFGQRLVANYDNSHVLALAFCIRGLQHVFPETYKNKEIVHMGTKRSFLSIVHYPVTFKYDQSQFIKEADKLVVFGDSLSDQGNLKKWLRIFPRLPYFAGRFSNEQIWVDYLARMTGIAVQNFAVGGSVAAMLTDPFSKQRTFLERAKKRARAFASGSIAKEISRYERNSLGEKSILDPKSTLFAVWIGGNDYIYLIESDKDVDIFLDHASDERIGSNLVIEKVTDNIIENIEKLYDLGARKFLVGNIPDMGKLPWILDNTSYHKGQTESRQQTIFTLSNKMTKITTNHNDVLKKKLDAFSLLHADSQLVFMDVFTGFSHASHAVNLEDGLSPFDYGLDQSFVQEVRGERDAILVNKACYHTPANAYKKQICIKPSRALFWDGVHPSTFGHCLISSHIHKAAAEHGLMAASSLSNYLDLCKPIAN